MKGFVRGCCARGTNLTLLALVFASGAALVSPARGQVGVSPDLFEMEVSNASSAATYHVSYSGNWWNTTDQSMTWSRNTAVAINDPVTGNLVATLRSASVFARLYPPRITVNFSLDAGPQVTTVFVTPCWVHFPTISDAVAQASARATFTLTDVNCDGANLLAYGPVGAGIFQADVNGQAPDGTLFSQLVSQISVDACGTISGWQIDPPSGSRPINLTLHDASTQIAFTLTPGDRVVATTRFDITGNPNPPGDLNCDGRFNSFDIDPFVTALLSPGLYQSLYPTCNVSNADVNADGLVNNYDVDAFIDLIF